MGVETRQKSLTDPENRFAMPRRRMARAIRLEQKLVTPEVDDSPKGRWAAVFAGLGPELPLAPHSTCFWEGLDNAQGEPTEQRPMTFHSEFEES